jgi:hypothetical protein
VLSSHPHLDKAVILPLKAMSASRLLDLKEMGQIYKADKFLTSFFIIHRLYRGVWKSELLHISRPAEASA